MLRNNKTDISRAQLQILVMQIKAQNNRVQKSRSALSITPPKTPTQRRHFFDQTTLSPNKVSLNQTQPLQRRHFQAITITQSPNTIKRERKHYPEKSPSKLNLFQQNNYPSQTNKSTNTKQNTGKRIVQKYHQFVRDLLR